MSLALAGASNTLPPLSALTYNPLAIQHTHTSAGTTSTIRSNAPSTHNTSLLLSSMRFNHAFSRPATPTTNQLSPALCNVAITLIEHTWHTTYHDLLQQPSLHLFNTRYVDHRYVLLNAQFRQTLPITTLAHPDFYEHPVEIEPVDDDHLLGFHIDLLNRTVTFQLPTHPWQIRDPQSAGSHRLRLSGLQSRRHTLRQYTYPQHLIPNTSQQLMQLYMTKGHSYEHCAAALRPRQKERDCLHFAIYLFMSFLIFLADSYCAGFGSLCVSTPVSKGLTLAIPTILLNHLYRTLAGGASSPSSLAPTKTLDVCW